MEVRVGMFNEPLRFSRFVHLFKREDVGGIWHALKLGLLFVKEPLLTLVQKFQYGATSNKILNRIQDNNEKDSFKQLLTKLKKLEMLVPIHYDEMLALKEIRDSVLQVSIGILYLLLTDKCNFRCKYCFIENSVPESYKFSRMTPETAKAALDLFTECIVRNPPSHQSREKTIIFYGGEPLINKEVFKFALEYINELKEKGSLPEKLRIALNTNGSLVDEEISQLIAKYGVRSSISIDGPQEIHNQLRKNYQGGGTFLQALQGYKILQQKNVPVSISCTIGPHNIDKLEEIFKWFIQSLGVRSMGFNLLLDTPGFEANIEYIKHANDKIIQCYKIARKYGIYEDRIMRKVKAFVNSKPYFIDCGGCGRQLVISPDGKIGPCHAYLSSKKYFVGEVTDSFNPFENSTFFEWSRRSPLNVPQCVNCEALGICGGGCVYNAEMRNGNMWAVDKLFCIHSKETLQWLIWDLYRNTILNRKEVKEDEYRVGAA